MNNKKGFTLIEIIVVLIIIGTLTTIALTGYNTMINQGASNAALNNLITIYNAEKNYYFNKSIYCTAACNSLNNINTTLSLNIIDNNFSYTCAASGSNYKCTATNISGTGITLTLLSPNQIVLPGSSNTLNPSCTPVGNPCCPN